MKEINVNLKRFVDNSYEILVGSDIFDHISKEIANSAPAYSYAVITDSNVEELYGNKIYSMLKPLLPVVEMISFPAGEQNKNRKYKEMIEDRLLDANFGRDSAIIAVGGGVVGDLAGFVAATYCRGIPHIQIPTSLVACVDSSVGGKTAVDTKQGKNLIGAFHQPWKVFIDISTLRTLARKEMQEGMAEVIKYGVISDPELFSLIENEIESIYAFDEETLIRIVEKSCAIKAAVVEKDEHESDLRKILNFGHTIGHAVENLSSYNLSHGRAISIGMVLEGKIAKLLGIWNEEDLDRLTGLIRKAGLPTTTAGKIDPDRMINAMKLDKKSRKGSIEMALPESIGSMKKESSGYGIKIEDKLIRQVLS